MRRTRRLIDASLVLAALVGLSLLPGASARATFPGTNGRIVFADQFVNQIFAVNPDGTGLVQLTPPGEYASWPASSPDGKHVAFTSTRSGSLRLWIMNADGSHQRMVADERHRVSQHNPAYTPDGTRLVYTRCVEGVACAIYSIGVDGTHRRSLTPLQGPPIEVFDFYPSVSPGGRIAFTRFDQNVNGIVAQVYVMRSDGSAVHAVSPARLEGLAPDWSPDGRWIAFTSDCCRLGSNIYVMDPHGTDVQRLTREAYPNNGTFPSYSPEGDQIAFVSDRRYDDFCCSDLFVMEANGEQEALISTGLVGVYDPSWATAVPLASGASVALAPRAGSVAGTPDRREALAPFLPRPLRHLVMGPP
jgi:TolB protein